MKGSFTDGFLFLPNRVFHGVHVFCHIRHMGYRFLLLPDLQIYHRADIGRDLTPDAGATLIHGVIPCALRDTCISPATNVCPTSQSTRQKIYPAFGCALSGPFNELRRPALSTPALCTCTSSFLLPPQWFHGRCSIDVCMIHRMI